MKDYILNIFREVHNACNGYFAAVASKIASFFVNSDNAELLRVINEFSSNVRGAHNLRFYDVCFCFNDDSSLICVYVSAIDTILFNPNSVSLSDIIVYLFRDLDFTCITWYDILYGILFGLVGHIFITNLLEERREIRKAQKVIEEAKKAAEEAKRRALEGLAEDPIPTSQIAIDQETLDLAKKNHEVVDFVEMIVDLTTQIISYYIGPGPGGS